jgi:DNA polymerase-3 subunit gamma/tau
VRDDGLDLRQFQKEVVMRLRELLHVKTGAGTEGVWTSEQVDEMQASIADVSRDTLVQALRVFGQADLRADPLSPLPLELALADATTAPVRSAAESAAIPRSAPRPAQPQQMTPRSRPEQPSQPPEVAEKVPVQLRKDLKNASAEDIAQMLGSKKPVIPPASDEPAEAETSSAAKTSNGAHIVATSGGTIDLDTFIDQKLRPLAKQSSQKLDALLNGSCKAVSLEGGVLTIGFFMDAHHKRTVEQPSTRKRYEDMASQILGEPVTIRCILAQRPAKVTKSPLVQHAVQAHGAKIVSADEES